ncbi:MAG: leucine-rich repeat domain-containing protein [Eubacterium sp.]|nr:leucine-rich repeat domain-containing protein [Eubacterium sp.]
MTEELEIFDWKISTHMAGSLDSDGTLTIFGTGRMSDYETSMQKPWNDNRLNITRIIISDGVTYIGKDAFYGCSNVTSVEISDSVTDIGDMAFGECSSLQSITLPRSMTRIGVSAFQDTGLTSITIPAGVSSIGHGAFSRAFLGFSKLQTVIFEGKVTEMGAFCFYNHGRELTTVKARREDMSYYAGHDALTLFGGDITLL